MVEQSINRLHDLVEEIPNLLMLITEERMSFKSSPANGVKEKFWVILSTAQPITTKD